MGWWVGEMDGRIDRWLGLGRQTDRQIAVVETDRQIDRQVYVVAPFVARLTSCKRY